MEDVKTNLDLKFKVMIYVGRPIGEVFEVVADSKKLSSYFATGGASARLETGKTVMWEFADFPGAFPVEVDGSCRARRSCWAGMRARAVSRPAIRMW